eukprot:scaffold8721_cov80-Phaeocystis_antarctica.AAC.17
MGGPFHGKTRQQPDASRRLVARAFHRRSLIARLAASLRAFAFLGVFGPSSPSLPPLSPSFLVSAVVLRSSSSFIRCQTRLTSALFCRIGC